MSAYRIQRYILKEISIPTAFSLLIFTFVLFMGRIPRITKLVVSKGVPAGEIVTLFTYLLPTFLSVTVPLSFLLGILLAFGRLSADSEYVAIKASGVSLYRLVTPVLFLAVGFVVLTGLITTIIEPVSKSLFRTKLFDIASSNLSINIKPGVFNDSFDGIVLYARGVDENVGTMQDLFIADERGDVTPSLILAQEGFFIPDPDNLRLILRLKEGSIHRQPEKRPQETYQTIRFNTYDININTGTAASDKRRRKRGEMSWTELDQAINSSSNKSSKRRLIAQKHGRIVIAFAPLVLVLIGVPLGLQSQRSGKGAGFALSLVVFLVYYVLLSIAGTIAEKGIVQPHVILWLPNLCFLTIGLFLLHRTANERPFKLLTAPQQLLLRKIVSNKKGRRQ